MVEVVVEAWRLQESATQIESSQLRNLGEGGHGGDCLTGVLSGKPITCTSRLLIGVQPAVYASS